MEEQQISKAFEAVSDNIEEITKNEERILAMMEEIMNDIEQLRKQMFTLAYAAQQLKQEIDLK